MYKKVIPFSDKQPAEKKTKAKRILPSNLTYCNLCGAKFKVSKELLREENVRLDKDGLIHDVVLTFIQCPVCGKHYPVIMDDYTTLPILQELQECMMKRVKCYEQRQAIPIRMSEKYNRLKRKLDFKRQQLAEKFDGAIYQLDGDIIQLDYRYHAR